MGTIIGGILGSALASPPPPPYPPPGPVVVTHPGASVADVQAALQHLGYYYGTVEGIAGPQTNTAIRSYQSASGLPVTGYIDGHLLRSLRL